MNVINVKKLYEVRQKIKELETEEEILRNSIKEEMITANLEEALVDNVLLKLKVQHRIEIDDEAIPYLKENGFSFLIVETCHQAKFKEMLNSGAFKDNYEDLKDFIRRKDIYLLYLKTRER